jgi:secreted Zn-dependent insulinase-like peptidase
MKTTKGDVLINTAIKYRKNAHNPNEVMYYSEQPLLDAQYPFLNRDGSMPDLNEYITKGVKSFQSVKDNPAMYNNSTDYLQKKTQEAAILQLINPFGGDD